MNSSSLSQLKLSQLRALVAVAEHGNFGEAALELGISQSAVSHAIATLEEALGVVLLSRGRLGAQLTPIGTEIIPHARNVLHSLESMAKAADLAKGLQGGQLRIASFRSAATHILPKAIAKFRQKFPAVNVSIHEYYDLLDVENALRTGQADIGFTILPTKDEFKAWKILEDEYVALLPETINLPNNQITWEQLSTYPLISLEDISHFQFLTDRLKLQKTPDIAYRVLQASTLLSMIAQGLGVTVFPRLAAEPIPAGVQVCRLSEPVLRVIGMAIVADALHSPAVFAFIESLQG